MAKTDTVERSVRISREQLEWIAKFTEHTSLTVSAYVRLAIRDKIAFDKRLRTTISIVEKHPIDMFNASNSETGVWWLPKVPLRSHSGPTSDDDS